MKRIMVIFILILFSTPMFSQYAYREMLYLPWGDADLEAGFSKAPGGQYGPMSFAVKKDTVVVLDSQNQSLKLFQKNALLTKINLPPQGADDFYWESVGHYFFVCDNQLLEYSNHKLISIYTPESPRFLITSLLKDRAGKVFVVLNESMTAQPTAGSQISTLSKEGILDEYGNFVQLIKQDWQTMIVNFNNNTIFKITSPEPNLGAAKFLGSTPKNELYIYIEKIAQQVPLRVNREIRLYDLKGTIKTSFIIPTHAHTYIFKEFFVDEKGNLFHMISSQDGIHIIQWSRTGNNFRKKSMYTYPSKFREFYHYNQIEDEEAEPKRQNLNEKETSDFEFLSVTRDEALAIGDTYVQHRWTAAANNLTNGIILAPDGLFIQTPTWIRVGENFKVPYQWGGFSTIDQFDQGLLAGKFAGDKYTDKSYGSSYCVGVDCSGFVSRCWKLASHYSTRMMDDYIAAAYSSWSQLLPADVVHKPGHVRLFVDFNANGSLLVVESTAKTSINFWRVGYFSYYLSDLVEYTPRYYIYMEGMPATIPQPELAWVDFDNNVHINWQITNPTTISGFHIYTSSTDANWTPALNGQALAPDKTSIDTELIKGSPRFYKLTGISSSDNNSEGFPSDAYGYFNTGSTNKILIVDGFDRTTGSYPFPYHTFAMTFGLVLSNFDYSFETASNDAVIAGKIQLNNYQAVMWLLGDESTDDETFNTTEQNLIKSYLQQGGNMFITGSEIAWDLDYQGSASDKDFIHNYLKTEYDQDDSESYTVAGMSGTVFEGLTLHYDDGTKGIYEEDWPDAFKPINGAYSALKYANGLIAATAYEGVVTGGNKSAKILIMGFPFETIYNQAERVNLIGKVLTFFDFTPTAISEQPTFYPQQLMLNHNYPNPFNSSTIISYRLPLQDRVVLKIINLIGEQVRVLIDEYQPPGEYKVYWDAQDDHGQPVASGIYFCQIQTSSFAYSKKMMLLR